MKISFQIIHNFHQTPLKIIGDALHQTLQDDMLLEIDLRTTLNFVEINFEKTLGIGNLICCFELNIDEAFYDFSNYDLFIKGFIEKVKSVAGFVKLIKYIDDFRLETYVNYYREIAEIEMKLREVFSYIFYNKYDETEQDLFEEFEVQVVNKDEVRTTDLIEKHENKFFYLTFKQYLKFDNPKDLPAKEVLPLIISNETYDLLRSVISSRGIIQERHLSFLKNVSKILDPIETVRNAIMHNRKVPKSSLDNYPEVREKALQFIDTFWTEEKQEVEQSFEPNFTDIAPYERINNLLSVSDWKEYSTEVVVHDHWQAATPNYTFTNLEELKSFLIQQSDQTFNASLPANEHDRASYYLFYNGGELVDKVLRKYTKELIIMNWI